MNVSIPKHLSAKQKNALDKLKEAMQDEADSVQENRGEHETESSRRERAEEEDPSERIRRAFFWE